MSWIGISIVVIRCDSFWWFTACFSLLIFVVRSSKFETLMRCRCRCWWCVMWRYSMWVRRMNIVKRSDRSVSCSFSGVILCNLSWCLGIVGSLHRRFVIDSELKVKFIMQLKFLPTFSMKYLAWCNCSSTCSTRCFAFPTIFVWLASSALRKFLIRHLIRKLKIKLNTSLP